MDEKFKGLVDQVEKMSVLELHELVKALEAHWGVSAAAVAVAGPAAAAAEEKSAYNAHLTDAGAANFRVAEDGLPACGRAVVGRKISAGRGLLDESSGRVWTVVPRV